MVKYSNMRALRALIKGSLQATFKSPSAIVFTIAFPLIFILVFGFLGGSNDYSIRVATAPGSDTTSQLYKALHQVPSLKWVTTKDTAGVNKLLAEGDIVATLNVKKAVEGVKPEYSIVMNAASSELQSAQQLQGMLKSIIMNMDPDINKRSSELVNINMVVSTVRDYKRIDFILPGQLSFSLLASGVFGTAFVFFNLRQTLVLKRYFATPVRREMIILGEGIARMVFQLMGSLVIIGIGYYAFGFSLYHGIFTVINMLVVCALGLLVFMGFGFVVSGVAKSDSAIPPFANLITMPQFLLSGTFFPIDNFPKWLQPLCRALPLTYLNDALRKISFDGANLWTVRMDMLIVLGWGAIVYLLAARVFKWE